MKFDFEKHAPKEETVPQVEKTQEQFDAEILEEAEKLGTNIQKLNDEINALGGPEKFQEFFSNKNNFNEHQYGGTDITVGGRYVKQDRDTENSLKKDSKSRAKISAFAALAPILAMVGEQSIYGETGFDTRMAFLSIPALGIAISSIVQKIKARKYERKAKIMELKMKMTDTPHEIKDK